MEFKYTIPGQPITKKNSQRIVYRAGKPMILPSEKYKEYEACCGWYIREKPKIDRPCNVSMEYYMKDRRRADLVNLEEATLDILVKYGVLSDDNYRIVQSMDGSCVSVDGKNPRCEITITILEENNERT